MDQFIIGIYGKAGSGKNAAATFLQEVRPSHELAFADPFKRIVRDVYQFSEQQLWGPSGERGMPDKRYPRDAHIWKMGTPSGAFTREGDDDDGDDFPVSCACCGLEASLKKQAENEWQDTDELTVERVGPCYLTPRFALQTIGSEFGRVCYTPTWIQLALREAFALLDAWDDPWDGSQQYDRMKGVHSRLDAARKNSVVFTDVRFPEEVRYIHRAGGTVIKLKRRCRAQRCDGTTPFRKRVA